MGAGQFDADLSAAIFARVLVDQRFDIDLRGAQWRNADGYRDRHGRGRRAEAKGNASQQSTRRTQSRVSVSQRSSWCPKASVHIHGLPTGAALALKIHVSPAVFLSISEML